MKASNGQTPTYGNMKPSDYGSSDRDNTVPNIPNILKTNPTTDKETEPGLAELKILNM